MNCFELLCGIGGYDVSSIRSHPGLFDRSLLPPVFLICAHFDVSGAALLWGGDYVRVVSRLMMSDDTGYGDWFPVAMTACSWIGGVRCCDWLYFVTQGAGLVAPPISRDQ